MPLTVTVTTWVIGVIIALFLEPCRDTYCKGNDPRYDTILRSCRIPSNKGRISMGIGLGFRVIGPNSP